MHSLYYPYYLTFQSLNLSLLIFSFHNLFFFFFFFNDTATTEIYTLSLHDALPISQYHADSPHDNLPFAVSRAGAQETDRKSTRLNSSHSQISYAVFCLKKKKKKRAT